MDRDLVGRVAMTGALALVLLAAAALYVAALPGFLGVLSGGAVGLASLDGSAWDAAGPSRSGAAGALTRCGS